MLFWRSQCAKRLFISFLKSFSLQGAKRNQTVFTKGTQTKVLGKKPSLFLNSELTRGQGDWRPALSLRKPECGPESTAWPSRRKLVRPRWMLQSCNMYLLQPINAPNDALNKSPYSESCFLFSFHVVSLSERIKAMRLLSLYSYRSSLK